LDAPQLRGRERGLWDGVALGAEVVVFVGCHTSRW
jgi:hypothetical protein